MQQYRKPILIIASLIFVTVCFRGIKRDLPFASDTDETVFLDRAIRMAAEGDPNPGWFGHPASTTIYPLALISHLLNFFLYDGKLLGSDPNLILNFSENWPQFYLFGRSLSVLYLALSLPFLYSLGRKAFDTKVATVGLLFFLSYPWPIFYSQVLRTDTSGLFFCTFTLWSLIRYYDRPTATNKFWSILGIGLAMSSRYFLLSLLIPLLLIDVLIERKLQAQISYGNLLRRAVISIVGVSAAFFLFSPFVILDYKSALASLQGEARNQQLGFDELRPLSSLHWYLTTALPENISWFNLFPLVVGYIAIILNKNRKQLILLIFTIVFLVGVSFLLLRWIRWILQLLPVLALISSYGFFTVTQWLTHLRNSTLVKLLTVTLFVFSVAFPLYKTAQLVRQRSVESTRVRSARWALEMLEPSSRIIIEPLFRNYLNTGKYEIFEQSWTPPDKSVAEFAEEGYDYLFVYHRFYKLYLQVPEISAEELEFYSTLFDSSCLAVEFEALTKFDYTMQVYDVKCLEEFSSS